MPKYKYVPKKVKIKLTRLKIIAFLLVVISLSILYLAYPEIKKTFPVKQIDYHGTPLVFRQDLRQASKIPVHPSEASLSIFYNPNIKTIYIAFTNTSQNSYVTIEAFEISYKLNVFYLLARIPVEIKGMQINSYSEAIGNATHPVIVLIPPIDANETAVKVSDYTVYISGKSLYDFDLATEKFLMVVLGIKV